MGTHSTVKFYDRRHRCILALYNQYDGYISGVGQELLDFFKSEDSRGNGIEDIALLYVCYKKQGKAYNTYLTQEYDNQEYNYEIFDSDEGLMFRIMQDKYWEEHDCYVPVPLLDWCLLPTFEDYITQHQDE